MQELPCDGWVIVVAILSQQILQVAVIPDGLQQHSRRHLRAQGKGLQLTWASRAPVGTYIKGQGESSSAYSS